MYMVEEIVQVPLGRHEDGRKYMKDHLQAMATEPGFRKGHIAAFLGNIRQHMFLSCWQDAASYEAWTKGEKSASLAKTRRPYTIDTEFGKHWEQFLETPGNSQGDFLNQGMLQVLDASMWDEYIEQRKGHDQSALEAGGLVYIESFKYVGEPIEPYYTPLTTAILVRRKDRAAYENSVLYGLAKESAQKPTYKSISPQLEKITGLYEFIYDVKRD